jgi:UDP-4-amino-4,6-dideoxy-N-acetyl-beta-L-altrosamine N-acetyltransferase
MIELRDITPADKETIRQWRNLPEVGKYMYTDHQISPEEHEIWFQRAIKNPANRYWIIVCDGEDVGLVNIYALDERNRRCYWAFYIASADVRGKGVGTFVEYSVIQYVFGVLGLNKLCCEVLGFNEAVVNMHKRFGFRQEGLYRKHIYKGGKYHDVVSLALLHADWEDKKLEIEEKLRGKGLLKEYD